MQSDIVRRLEEVYNLVDRVRVVDNLQRIRADLDPLVRLTIERVLLIVHGQQVTTLRRVRGDYFSASRQVGDLAHNAASDQRWTVSGTAQFGLCR